MPTKCVCVCVSESRNSNRAPSCSDSAISTKERGFDAQIHKQQGSTFQQQITTTTTTTTTKTTNAPVVVKSNVAVSQVTERDSVSLDDHSVHDALDEALVDVGAVEVPAAPSQRRSQRLAVVVGSHSVHTRQHDTATQEKTRRQLHFFFFSFFLS